MTEDTPLLFGRTERSGLKTSYNDALIITALLANYEIGRIFIDSGNSTDILFEEAYDHMQLGDISLEKVNTSLYGFAGEVVHPRGMISLPLTLGTGVARRTCMLKFLVVDVPSAYNVILGRPTLNAFQAVISTYHIKIKFPTQAGQEKFRATPSSPESFTSRLCVKDKKEHLMKPTWGLPPGKKERIYAQKKSLGGRNTSQSPTCRGTTGYRNPTRTPR
ncbi:UNVERIFIED_CONTAM: hypothetical protein Sradi_5233800 [Sesamum radiatum]|uniref:Peptidase A2 domain-containing protein n=1 Tax=Sesamum radiatum TaxID=300843 RepID=A0AAW2LM10_SESRA